LSMSMLHLRVHACPYPCQCCMFMFKLESF
jgi:hypothetical protein